MLNYSGFPESESEEILDMCNIHDFCITFVFFGFEKPIFGLLSGIFGPRSDAINEISRSKNVSVENSEFYSSKFVFGPKILILHYQISHIFRFVAIK